MMENMVFQLLIHLFVNHQPLADNIYQVSDKLALFCQKRLIMEQKKIAQENKQKAIKIATEAAEAAVSDGKAFCICKVDVGSDDRAVREAVVKVTEQKVACSIFSFLSLFFFSFFIFLLALLIIYIPFFLPI